MTEARGKDLQQQKFSEQTDHTGAADTHTRRGGLVSGSTYMKSPVSFAQSRKIQGIAQSAIKVRDTPQS